MQDAFQKRTSKTDAQVHFTGGCQCGAIRYAVTDEPITAATCHCRDCQYSSGGAPAHALLFPAGSVTLLRGAARTPLPRRFGRAVMRSFCPDCGTPLFGGTEGANYDVVRAGSLDDRKPSARGSACGPARRRPGTTSMPPRPVFQAMRHR